jgi:hypothetical protein
MTLAEEPRIGERRKSLRVAVKVDCYFNILGSPGEYSRGFASVLKRLAAIDSIKAPEAKNESQVFLSRIDQKLSILVGILAERAQSRKTYIQQGAVMDICEHGMALAHTMEIEKGAALEIGLQLPTDDIPKLMDIAGKVVCVRKNDSGTINIYGLEFFDIKPHDQNDIVQWIFAQQREQIQRRRGKEG